MNLDKLKINQLIDIVLEMPTGEGSNPVCEYLPSRIEDLAKDRLTIAMPFKHGYPVPIRIGEYIRLKFIQNKEAYTCDVQVVGRHLSPIAVLKVTMPEKVIHIQQRNWVRFPYNTQVKYRRHNSNDDLSQAISIDISGGGLLMLTKHPLEVNMLLDVEFSLDNLTISAIGTTIRCIPVDDLFRVGIRFEEITQKDCDKIIGFIFQKQREIIQKGLK